ncbi:hypothetical protein CC78DRAFT_132026 [Lojkania enalia]|uniref:Uncharacterized protein n=1 Tax=Lojkania enalia TaxID=147567 RepID=A0A9P4NBW2_9PLEO|nr:hypothetical protein CC78DRAFT_132026 [Didymosphaeria enalia]
MASPNNSQSTPTESSPGPLQPSPLSEETLPDYEPTPEYSAPTLQTYHFRATKSKTSHLVPFGPSQSSPSYEITYRSTTALPIFNRNGDISISRTISVLDANITKEHIARADFETSGPTPWYPRATLSLRSAGETELRMGASDWRTWTFTYGSRSYAWTLRHVPSSCLELLSPSSSSSYVIARFTYGLAGMKVLAGGEVGKLDIFRDGLTEGTKGVDVVVAGCVVVIKYFEGLGRRYRNDGAAGGVLRAAINPRARKNMEVKFVW